MPYTSVTLKADGTRTTQEHAKAPDYEFLKGAVGGYIETLGYFTKFEGHARCTAYCNENGWSEGLARNVQAARAYRESFPNSPSVIVGDVVIYWKHPKVKA